MDLEKEQQADNPLSLESIPSSSQDTPLNALASPTASTSAHSVDEEEMVHPWPYIDEFFGPIISQGKMVQSGMCFFF